ncbi:ABC transporter permease [Propionibacteriaceae bacterium G1746]|uniref:ABC transporter permease n=1 Tax=Aestuariimicrobium sp. G57 TaxID=3418485 RepID=UPI003C24F6E5
MSTEVRRHRGSFWRLFGSEMQLMLSKWRNRIGMGVLALFPIMVTIGMWQDSRSGGMSEAIGGVTNGLVVAMLALIAESAMFLPLAVAMLSGDSIAGEANQGTLRYLLTVPVGRTRLLAVKYLSLMVGAVIGTVIVLVVGAVLGTIVLGGGTSASLSGTTMSYGQTLWRLVIAGGYVCLMLWAIAAIGLFFSTLVDQPMAVTVAVMVVVVLMWILLTVNQLDWLHPWLLTHRMQAFLDVMRDPIHWSTMRTGALVALGYIVVFTSLAWARFTGKDIST